MKKLKWLIPSILIFGSPWVHGLCYENIMLAVPNVSLAGAQIAAIFITLISLIVSVFIIGILMD